MENWDAGLGRGQNRYGNGQVREEVKYDVVRLSRAEWVELAEDAHKTVFSELRPASMDRSDYTLLVVDQGRLPIGYATVRELDADSVYWQYGGAFPSSRLSPKALKAYQAIIEWTKDRYKRVTTLVENSNIPYLKMAFQVGFRIIGVRVFGGSVLCELILEFEEK